MRVSSTLFAEILVTQLRLRTTKCMLDFSTLIQRATLIGCWQLARFEHDLMRTLLGFVERRPEGQNRGFKTLAE